jgi:N-acetylglucosaminyldiphosphoundecaprenol N-acetyl-beta-D-mannosaminyltransferase
MEQHDIRLKQVKFPFLVGSFEQVGQTICQKLSQSVVILPTSLNDLASVWHKPQLANVYLAVDIATTDGMPLVYWFRLKTDLLAERVYGPELTEYILGQSDQSLTHYLLAANAKAELKMRQYIQTRFPKVKLAGSSFLEKNEQEQVKQEQILNQLKQISPDVLWLGIGSPKQVQLAQDWKNELPQTTIFCVGAAFNLLTGLEPMAPRIMRNIGLEWLYRLVAEPRRLWKRYLVRGPVFIIGYLFQRFKSIWT